MNFVTLIIWEIRLQILDLILPPKILVPSLPFPPPIFSYHQALIHSFLWWWACSWLIFFLKWRLQSSFFLLHSTAIDLQKSKDSIDEEDPMPTSFTWNYIIFCLWFLVDLIGEERFRKIRVNNLWFKFFLIIHDF